MSTAEQIVHFCRENNIHFAFAESCTGGKLAAAIVDVPGASDVFHGSFVTYSDGMKMEALDVDPYTLGRQTAVSKRVAQQMAFGALHRLNGAIARTDAMPRVFTCSTTGYVGPYSGPEPHVAYIGLVGFFSSRIEVDGPLVHEIGFKGGDRKANQEAIVERALHEIADLLEKD